MGSSTARHLKGEVKASRTGLDQGSSTSPRLTGGSLGKVLSLRRNKGLRLSCSKGPTSQDSEQHV